MALLFFFATVLCVSSSSSFFVDLAELRKKFEEDKARIQRLKQARKFKP